MSIFAGTGHRPPKLGGYGENAMSKVEYFARDVLDKFQPSLVISGMAIGWDQALAWGAIQLSIPYVAAVPFTSQASRWPLESQRRYHHLLERAKEVVTVSSGEYSARAMQARNEWMVDHCDYVLALWDGSSGGTLNCVKYANRVGKTVMNVWRPFSEYKLDEVFGNQLYKPEWL